MFRNEYVVMRIDERDVLLRQTAPPFEFLVNKSDLEPTVASKIKVGDVFSGIDRGSTNPFDLVLKRKELAERQLETQSDPLNFKFVPRLKAETAQEAESYSQSDCNSTYVVIPGKILRVANGWLVPIGRVPASFLKP